MRESFTKISSFHYFIKYLQLFQTKRKPENLVSRGCRALPFNRVICQFLVSHSMDFVSLGINRYPLRLLELNRINMRTKAQAQGMPCMYTLSTISLFCSFLFCLCRCYFLFFFAIVLVVFVFFIAFVVFLFVVQVSFNLRFVIFYS